MSYNEPGYLVFDTIPDEYRPISKPSPRRVPKQPGRNEKCPCGSGKKFKKCCMKYFSVSH